MRRPCRWRLPSSPAPPGSSPTPPARCNKKMPDVIMMLAKMTGPHDHQGCLMRRSSQREDGRGKVHLCAWARRRLSSPNSLCSSASCTTPTHTHETQRDFRRICADANSAGHQSQTREQTGLFTGDHYTRPFLLLEEGCGHLAPEAGVAALSLAVHRAVGGVGLPPALQPLAPRLLVLLGRRRRRLLPLFVSTVPQNGRHSNSRVRKVSPLL